MKKIFTPVYCLLYDETEKEVQDLKKRKKECEKPKNIVKMNKTQKMTSKNKMNLMKLQTQVLNCNYNLYNNNS